MAADAEHRVATADTSTGTVDFDLHGYVGVRLLDARPADASRVERQLGPLRSPLTREPDITVRFVDSIDVGGRLTYAEWPTTGFTEDAFYLLKGKGGIRGVTHLPFEDVGRRCAIVIERGVPAVPLLLAVVNFTALAKGLLPLHASAYVLDGTGVLAAGWAKGGKTETLLGAMAQGADYVGDEWVYVTPDGDMLGVPEPIRLWRWQLAQLPEFWQRVPAGDRRRILALAAADRGVRRITPEGAGSGFVGSVLRRGAPVLARQVYAQVGPARLFGQERLALRGRIDQVLFVSSHEDPSIRVDEIDPADVADRMTASLAEEREPFMATYRQFRFAFPGRRSEVVDAAEALERDLLHAALRTRPTAWLRHPYPVDIAALAHAARGAVQNVTARSAS